jgi:hypothetical protein
MPGVKNRCLLSSINGQRTKHCELAQEIGERRSATIPEAANELGAENGRVSARLNALQVPSFADEQKLPARRQNRETQARTDRAGRSDERSWEESYEAVVSEVKIEEAVKNKPSLFEMTIEQAVGEQLRPHKHANLLTKFTKLLRGRSPSWKTNIQKETGCGSPAGQELAMCLSVIGVIVSLRKIMALRFIS